MAWFKQLLDSKLDSFHTRPKCDGLYISQIHIQNSGSISTHGFLKFDDDGNVLGIEISFSPGVIDQVVEQFHTIPDNILTRGKYQVQRDTLTFSLASSEGTIDYTGQIVGDRLKLHMHSRISGYESDEVYWFVATRQSQIGDMPLVGVAKNKAKEMPNVPAAIPRAKQEASRFSRQAWACDQNNDCMGAIANFDQALRIDPLDHNSYYGRGVIYCKTRNYTMAIADLNRALDLIPNFPAALTERGLALVESKDLTGGMADYDRAIRVDPTYAYAHINKGSAYALQGKWAEALICLNEGIRLRPQASEAAYINRATAYEQLGDCARAAADLRAYLRIYPQGCQTEQAQKHLAFLEDKIDK